MDGRAVRCDDDGVGGALTADGARRSASPMDLRSRLARDVIAAVDRVDGRGRASGGVGTRAAVGTRSEAAAVGPVGPDRTTDVTTDRTDTADRVARLVARVVEAVEGLGEGVAELDPAGLEAVGMRELLVGVERARRVIDAAGVAVAGMVDRGNPFAGQGWCSARTVLKHVLQLSGPEAHRRLQTARMQDRLPEWAAAERCGVVGVAQCELMGRVAANPRVGDELLCRDAPALLDDAVAVSFEEFERRARTWEALADTAGDRDRNARDHDRRDVMLRPNPDSYGWSLQGSLPEVAGAELMGVWARFVEAEWDSDWADARARLGDRATTADLARSEPQRRADATVAMARAAATTLPGGAGTGGGSLVTVNVLVDQLTLEAHLRGESPDPAHYRHVVCRTQAGRRVHPDDAVNSALIGHVRRVVLDSAGTIIDLGRRSRLFRGAAREAVMLMHHQCVWAGCDRPVHWCDADHSRGWKAHGATVPRNGAPLCRAHNLLKEHGYGTYRDPAGNWHTTDPRGQPIN